MAGDRAGIRTQQTTLLTTTYIALSKESIYHRRRGLQEAEAITGWWVGRDCGGDLRDGNMCSSDSNVGLLHWFIEQFNPRNDLAS